MKPEVKKINEIRNPFKAFHWAKSMMTMLKNSGMKNFKNKQTIAKT